MKNNIVDLVKKLSIDCWHVYLLPFNIDTQGDANSETKIIPSSNPGGGPTVSVKSGKIYVHNFCLGSDEIGEEAFSFDSKIKTIGNFILEVVDVVVRIEFDKETIPPELKDINTELKIFPSKIDINLTKNNGIVELKIPVQIEQVGFFDLHLMDQIRLAFADGIMARGNIKIKYRIASKSQVTVVPANLNQWDFSGDPMDLGRWGKNFPKDRDVHKKIYQLSYFVNKMLPESQIRNLEK